MARFRRRMVLALMAASACSTLGVRGQLVPNFSGTWILDAARSDAPVAVWGQTRARVITVTQDATLLSLVTEDGGLGVPVEVQRYRLDGQPSVFIDRSLGDLPNFVRKVRTEAHWVGDVLATETETFNESIDERTGMELTGHGITCVLHFRLSPDGQQLMVERTGFRRPQPSELHGRPYSQKQDFAYNIDRVRYLRSNR